MLEELENKNDENRKKVIEFIKESQFDLKRYKIQDYEYFPGGVELIDKKGRSIIIYNNYLLESVEVIYKDLKEDAMGVYLEVVMFLIDEYKEKAQEKHSKQDIKVEKIDEFHIRFSIRAKQNNIISISPVFDINNELYDIHEYLREQIDCIAA